MKSETESEACEVLDRMSRIEVYLLIESYTSYILLESRYSFHGLSPNHWCNFTNYRSQMPNLRYALRASAKILNSM